MKQSSKPYGIAKPHIRVSEPSWKMEYYPYLTILYKRFSAFERGPHGYIFHSGNGETIGSAWGDLEKKKAEHEEWKAKNPQFMALLKMPTITIVSK